MLDLTLRPLRNKRPGAFYAPFLWPGSGNSQGRRKGQQSMGMLEECQPAPGLWVM